MLNILFFGDVVGSVGRQALAKVLPGWKKTYAADLVIANGENIAHGKGVSRQTLQELLGSGVDIVTSGNHIWSFKEVFEIFQDETVPLLRPANYSSRLPGKGMRVLNVGTRRVLVVNLMGQVAMHAALNSPFEKADEILELYGLPGSSGGETMHAIVVDWHAEATSEKMAMGRYLDGRVSAVLGTHTHVPTADEMLLPKGTAYQSDVGMVGSRNSIIGVRIEPNLKRFLLQTPVKLEVEESSPVDVNAALVSVDPKTGLASSIRRLRETVEIA